MEHEVVKQFLMEVAEVAKKCGFSPDTRSLKFEADPWVSVTELPYRFLVQKVNISFENRILTERQYLGAQEVYVGMKE